MNPLAQQSGITRTGPLTYEASPRWVRARVGDVTVADSTQTVLLWEQGKALPVYLFPRDDVRTDLLRPSQNPLPEAHHGLASLFDLDTGGRSSPNAAWTYDGCDDEQLSQHVAFDWEVMDVWLEEEETLLAHPRDPYHRVDTRRSHRHVRVEHDGRVLAESDDPSLVFETNLPTRYYLPREDVRMELLEPSGTRTLCAYKGEASYWSVPLDGEIVEDVAFTYDAPLSDNTDLTGLLCFLNEHVDIVVDGQPVGRPQTQWSAGLRSNVSGGGSGAEQSTHGSR